MDDYSSLSREELIFKLQSAERLINEQRKLLQAKDTMLQSYVQQFNQLTSDYERLIENQYQRSEYQGAPAPAPERPTEFQPPPRRETYRDQ